MKAQSHAQTDVGGSVLIDIVDAASVVEVVTHARFYISAEVVTKQVFGTDTTVDGELWPMFG